jgi:hypothetical protein
MLSWRYQGAATFRLVYFVHLAGFVKPEKMYRANQFIFSYHNQAMTNMITTDAHDGKKERC